jgi:hypothetical protein
VFVDGDVIVHVRRGSVVVLLPSPLASMSDDLSGKHLGPEWDGALLLRLRQAVAELGGTMREVSWGVGGSQEICEYEIHLRGVTLTAIGETYMGLVLRGPHSMVEELAGMVSRSHGGHA